MNISNRLYTHPVLCEDTNDYVNSFFQAKASQQNSTLTNLILDFEMILENHDIRLLIQGKKAEYAIHIECPATSYRKIIHGRMKDEFSYSIPYSMLNGNVELVAFILATRDIIGFSSKDLDDDFNGIEFNMKKGDVLAYDNLPDIFIDNNFHDLTNASSIFMIYKGNSSESCPMTIEMGGDKLAVGLSPKEYNLFNTYSSKMRKLLNTLVILPALVYVFEELRRPNGEEEYYDKRWYVSLEISYKKRKKDFREELMCEKTSLQLAQEAMELPITSALESIQGIFDYDESEE